jgi:hypothetical protein
MDIIKELSKNNISEEAIIFCADFFYKTKYNRNYLEAVVIIMCSLIQLNSDKNTQKEPLENYHPLELIKLLREEVNELENEFKTEQKINIQRVLEELGDVGAYLSGIVAAVRKL